jgi:glycosyltransferase involved in cell wall biosynthesis
VAASHTAPVREVIAHEENGLLFDFFDLDEQCELVTKVLADPAAFRPLAQSGQALIERQYSLEVCLPRILELYRSVA